MAHTSQLPRTSGVGARTNNDLEHAFGMLRYHQRRCIGRKVAPSSLIIRGCVKLACA